MAAGGSVSAGRQTIVDALIVGLKADGIFAKLDRLWLFAAENTQSALIDIIADAQATAVNSPTFTVDRGFTGASTALIDTNFAPTTAPSPHYVRNSGSLMFWSNKSASDTEGAASSSASDSYIYPNQAGTAFFGVNESSFTLTASVSDGLGLYHANRSGASAQQAYKNGASVATNSQASIPVTAGNMRFLKTFNTFWGGQGSAGGIGESLSSAEAGNLFSRLRTYMTAVGVP